MGFPTKLKYIRVSRYSFFAVLVILLLVLFTVKDEIKSLSYYEYASNVYARIVGVSVSKSLTFWGYESSYSLTYDMLTLQGIEKFGIQGNLAIKFYIFLALVLIPFSTKPFRAILYTLIGALVLFIISVSQLAGSALLSERAAHSLVAGSYILRFLLVGAAILYRIYEHKQLRLWFQLIHQQFGKLFQLPLPVFLFLFLTSVYWMSIIDRTLIHPGSNFVIHYSHLLLSITNWLVELANYQPVVSGCYIWLDNVWVYLGSPCLGVGIISLFTALILIIRSKTINKFLFITFGIVLLVLMNAVRIAFILLHLYHHGKYTLSLEIHDLSNYFFYAIVFLLLLIYIVWFQHLTFTLKKTYTNGTPHQTPSDN